MAKPSLAPLWRSIRQRLERNGLNLVGYLVLQPQAVMFAVLPLVVASPGVGLMKSPPVRPSI
ncbi:hypothetical protein ACFFS4_05885, partial [Kutzneria kofuensis]|uniref:hypothetical protein n=1 Tax=Kutzneria kofuensis TaxID=103725 RepID=UPI0035EBFC80